MTSYPLLSEHLKENLWATFKVGRESFTLLGNLYSFSAIEEDYHPERKRDYLALESPMEEFLASYVQLEQMPGEDPNNLQLHELVAWLERDWIDLHTADEYLKGKGEYYYSGGGPRKPSPRTLFTELLFLPQERLSNWVIRLWQETLKRNDGDRIAAEVELMFLCDPRKKSAFDYSKTA